MIKFSIHTKKTKGLNEMNKKEISEIRKLFTPDNSVITRICGCYVDGEKEIKCKTKEAFHSLSEDEAFKYFEIFKRSLSGTLGKNLLNLDFPLDQEMESGTQDFLLKLRNDKLEDDTLLDEFYNKVIDNYEYPSNYYIILIHAIYDIPGKSSDGDRMFDASDEVYDYILCSICPVNLNKSGLSYHANEGRIGECIRDWVVSPPAKSFLFPVFNERQTDIHSLLYYSKNPQELQLGFIENVFGATEPMSAESQKEAFHSIITETLGDECNYDVVKNIHENLNEMIEENKAEPEPLVIAKNELRHILEESGVPNEKMEIFEETYNSTAGDKTSLLASNIAEMQKFNIQTPDVIIKVNPDRTDLVQTKIIDGRQCLVIAVDDHIEVNGVSVRTMKSQNNTY